MIPQTGSENIERKIFATSTGLKTRLAAFIGERRAATFAMRTRVLLGSLRRTPLRAKTPWQPPPFFIVGPGRSGTTLLRAMLHRHTDICIPPELEVTGTLARDFLAINALPWRPLSRLCMARVVAHRDFEAWGLDGQRLFDTVARLPIERQGLDQILGCLYEAYRNGQKPGACLIGDKTPLNTLYLDWIDAIFPNARYLHVLRDGRAVVESAVRAWGDLSDEVSILKGCDIWRERTRRARSFCAGPAAGRSTEVRYEDLVCNPELSLRNVSDFLGIEFQHEMLEHRVDLDDLGDTVAAHMSSLAEPLRNDRNSRWRELPASTQEIITSSLADDLRELGYL